MSYLTNLKWTEIYLMNMMDDRTLCLYGQINKITNKLYKSKEFWITRIIVLFGNDFLKHIDNKKSWIYNYKFIKMLYCYYHDIPLYKTNDFKKLSKKLIDSWTRDAFSKALKIFYNFNLYDIKIMIDNDFWSIFDRLPGNNYYNQIKTDIYFLKGYSNLFESMQLLGYNLSVNAIISRNYKTPIKIYFADHIPSEPI